MSSWQIISTGILTALGYKFTIHNNKDCTLNMKLSRIALTDGYFQGARKNSQEVIWTTVQQIE